MAVDGIGAENLCANFLFKQTLSNRNLVLTFIR